MRGKVFFSGFSRYSSIMLICLLVMLLAFGCRQKTGDVGSGEQKKDVRSEEQVKELVFDMDEVSVFDVSGTSQTFFRGQSVYCYDKPRMADVAKYPRFKSDKPIYGSVRFAGQFSEDDSKHLYYFAVDESAGTSKGYDQLYFDTNRDLDLTNDTPLVPLDNPPEGAKLSYSLLEQQICFEYLNVNFDFGSEGQRVLEIMPRLMIYDSGYKRMNFVSTRAHVGEIKIAGRQYTAFLGHNYIIQGWFDHPSTALHLIPKDDKGSRSRWLCADQLRAIHKISGTYYRFSATPAGDKLFVRPYDGEFGTFKIGSEWRLIFNKNMSGSLLSKDAALAVGSELELDRPKEAQSYSLPVGDYLPSMLYVKLGPMSISVSDNYHSDGKSRDRSGRPPVCGIKIRKNKPFVLDFSNKPNVIFASPAVAIHIKPGDMLDVKAVLVDPELDIMIRDIRVKPSYADSTLPIKLSLMALFVPGMLWLLLPRLRRRCRFLPVISVLGAVVLVGCLVALRAMGPRLNYEKISPRVLITRAGGEKVAEGVMPFG